MRVIDADLYLSANFDGSLVFKSIKEVQGLFNEIGGIYPETSEDEKS